MEFLKDSILYSIFTGSCPVCHNESMYLSKNPYNFSKVISMHERCSNCNTKYQMEPSFFYGAMYVSYGVGVALGIMAFLIAHYIFQLNLMGSFLFIIGTVLGLFPFILRLSRNIWINLFLSFDKTKSKANTIQND